MGWDENNHEKKKIIPSYYHGELYKKFQSLTQASKSIEDYHKKIKVIMIHVNIAENIEATMVDSWMVCAMR